MATINGTAWNDTYTIDEASTNIIEAQNGGIDTVQARVSYTLRDNVENLTLWGVETQEINGQIVYGNPLGWANHLDYFQGDNAQRIGGSCKYVAAENLSIQLGIFEPKINYLPSATKTDPLETAVIKMTKGSFNIKNIISEINPMYNYNIAISGGLNQTNINITELANFVRDDYCVTVLCDAYVLWGTRPSFKELNHAITVTGVAYNKDNPSIVEGFYICDSGRKLKSDASRYIAYDLMSKIFCSSGSYGDVIISNNPTKQYLDNIDATGNELDNSLRGNSGNNSLYGLGGNDTLNGAGGFDTLYGGAGDDVYYVNGRDTIIEANNEGNDTVCALVAKEYSLANNIENFGLWASSSGIILNGNNLNNVILSGEFNDTLNGGLGDDALDGAVGADMMVGGLGNDTYYLDNIHDSICELVDAGNDTVISDVDYVLGKNLEVLQLADTSATKATGNASENNIFGNSNNNILDGKEGADSMFGNGGDDLYYVDNSEDFVFESSNGGIDTVRASVSFTIDGDIENLELLGKANIYATGNDMDNNIKGNSRNNIIDGKAGVDVMAGAGGNDTYYVDNLGDLIVEKGAQGSDTVISSISYTLGANVENLTLSESNDINATGNTLNNYIIGNSGVNFLDGGYGNDTLDGSSNHDAMMGGFGNDTYYVDNQGDIVIENFNQGKDLIFSSVTFELNENIENLTLTGLDNINGYGNSLNNIITGNVYDNILDGDASADKMIGGLGDDTYFVENTKDSVCELKDQGADSVKSSINYTLSANLENLELIGADNLKATGNAFNNVIIGNSGDNIIDAKAGADNMSGADGNDTYILNKGYGLDNITDTSGDFDQISFGSSVNKAKIAMFIDANDDLLIDYGSTIGVDRVTIKDWDLGSSNQIEKVKLSNGKILTNTDINQIIQEMSGYADANDGIAFSNINDVKSNTELLAMVSDSWHAA